METIKKLVRNTKQSKISLILLICILAAAFAIRLYKLETTPSGFHQDEVVNAYIGRFIFTNGVDIYGNPWPLLYFNKWGDFPPVVPMYISALGTYLFGLNRLGARFVNALVGAFIVIPIYYIALTVFKRKKTALFSALLIALLPWHVAFSRMATEGILASTVYMAALSFFIYSDKSKKAIWFIVSCLLFFSTYLLYPGYRIFVPLTFLAIFIYAAIERKSKKYLFLLFILIVISSAATLLISNSQWGKSRFMQTSFLRSYDPKASQQFIYNESNVLTARLFNIKYFYMAREFIRQYVTYFSPSFLFIDGGLPQWFSFPNSGLLYLFCSLLFFPILLFNVRKNNKNINGNLFILLVLLTMFSVIPAALTNEQSPNTHRSLILGIFFIFIFSYGFFLIQDVRIKKIPVWILLFCIGAVECISFSHNYFQHVSMYTAIPRSDGNFQAAQYIQKNKNNYDSVYMMATGWFPLYYLYTAGNFSRSLVGNVPVGLRMKSVENIQFIDRDYFSSGFTIRDIIMENTTHKKYLIIVNSASSIPNDKRLRIIGSINASNHLPIYTLLELQF